MPEPNGPQGFIPPHGGFADLISYQKSAIVFDITHLYCERFLRRGDRTFDQMIQAARSGKQNIVEASLASGTSKETEIKLTNVARATYDTDTLEFGVGGLVGALSSGITGANVRLGAPGVDGPVVIPVVPVFGLTGGPIYSAIVTLTPEQVSDLFGGLWYISVETADFPEGEIRGQIQLVVSRIRRLADRSVAGVCVAMVERRP